MNKTTIKHNNHASTIFWRSDFRSLETPSISAQKIKFIKSMYNQHVAFYGRGLAFEQDYSRAGIRAFRILAREGAMVEVVDYLGRRAWAVV